MPRITNLSTDSTVRDNDYLIGYDGDASNAAKKMKLSAIKDYVDETTLDGFRDGRFLAAFSENFLETPLHSSINEEVLLDGTGDEEDNSIIATSQTALAVGSAIRSVVFAGSRIQSGDLLVIENEDNGDRDFGVVDEVDAFNGTITLDTNQSLSTDWMKFNGTSGYGAKVSTYRFNNVTLEGDLILTGQIKDELGETILNPNDVVSLSGNNDFTGEQTMSGEVMVTGNLTTNSGDVTFEDGIQIGADDENSFILNAPEGAISENQVLAAIAPVDGEANTLAFAVANDLLVFDSDGTDTNDLEDWTRTVSASKISSGKLPAATASNIGAVKPGTNVSVSADGTLNISGSNTATINVVDGTGDSDVDYDNVTDIKFTGTAVAEINEVGTEVTVEVNSGATIFGTDSTNVSVWAKGDDTSDIPIGKLGAILTNTGTYTSKQNFASGIQIGDGDEAFDIVEGASAASEGQSLVANSSGNFVPTTIPLLSTQNTFTNIQQIQRTEGGVLEMQRTTQTPESNHILGSIDYLAYSRDDGNNEGLGSYQHFASVESRYLSNENFEYGQFRIDTNYVTLGDAPALTSLTALTIDRFGMTSSVDATFNSDVTIGDAAADTLTVNATSEFTQPISGSITKVVNDRDSSETFKVWHGTQAQYDALDSTDDNTIYFVV